MTILSEYVDRCSEAMSIDATSDICPCLAESFASRHVFDSTGTFVYYCVSRYFRRRMSHRFWSERRCSADGEKRTVSPSVSPSLSVEARQVGRLIISRGNPKYASRRVVALRRIVTFAQVASVPQRIAEVWWWRMSKVSKQTGESMKRLLPFPH